MDDDLAAFAINVPQKEEPEPPKNDADDFLAQFAIRSLSRVCGHSAPAVQPDDFLAQFAIPTPGQEPVQQTPAYEEPDEMADIATNEQPSDSGTTYSGYETEPVSSYANDYPSSTLTTASSHLLRIHIWLLIILI